MGLLMSEEERNGLIKQRRLLREKCEKKDKEIKRLNKIIEELKAILKSKGYETYIPVLEGSDKE